MSIEQTREILSHEELSDADIVHLLGLTDPEECELLRKTAYDRTTELMGSFVYYRGLIEFSNICTASCRYCGIRRENHDVERYTMSKEEIVAAAKWAADQGYGSICLQSGERRDEKYIAFVESCLEAIHEATVSEKLPDGVGVTLSLGEQTIETYRRLAKASGNPSNLRYLARFETSNPELFKVLHGARGDHEKELQNRFRMLRDLREAGYQVGTGVMIGIPGQSLEDLCRDIRTFQQFDVDMIGMGPYLMSEGGELQEYGQMEPKALLQLALNMIAVTRLVLGPVNIAAATALQAIRDDGRELGVSYGANVVMPNLSPQQYREGYQLYDNKPCLDDEPTQCASCLENRLRPIGRSVGWNMSGSSRRWLRRNGRPERGFFHPYVPHPQGIFSPPVQQSKAGRPAGRENFADGESGNERTGIDVFAPPGRMDGFPKTRVNPSKTQESNPALMKSEIRTILLGIGQFLFCALLSASAYGLYVLNLRVSVPVESLIELGQEALLLSAAIFTLRTASLEKALSGGLWLVGGFLVALYIRELDGWIGHAWVYCELVWLCGVAWAVKAAGLGTVIPGLAHFIGHRAFPIMCAGVAILLVYSRLYGMQTLWLAYAGEACSGLYSVKTLSEESTELLAYMMIFTSAAFYAGNCLRMRRRRARAERLQKEAGIKTA